MPYLARPKAAPRAETLPEAEQRYIAEHFDAHPAELTVNGQVIRWQDIDEVEVVKAARQRTLAGWFVRNILYTDERYHVGIYVGSAEAVLPNISQLLATFIVLSIAYYMQKPVLYSGVEGFVPVQELD
jgi:hypothetical protein